MGFTDNYNLRLSKSGGSIRQENINSARAFLKDKFRDDPAFYTPLLNGVETPMRIYDKNSPVVGYGHKYIQLLDLSLPPLGGYVFWNNRYWLITNTDESNELKATGTIRECNHCLKWLSDNGGFVERWGVFCDSTRYSPGASENRYLILGDTRYELYLPKDEETIRLPRDKRFIIDDFEHSQIGRRQF